MEGDLFQDTFMIDPGTILDLKKHMKNDIERIKRGL